MSNISYLNTLLKTFSNMLDGEVKALKIKEASYPGFVQEVKNIIDQKLDIKNGFEIEFNTNYSKIRKRVCSHYTSPNSELKTTNLL